MKKSPGISINFRGSWGTLMIVRVILYQKSQLLVFVKSENRLLEKKRKKKRIYMRFEVEHMSSSIDFYYFLLSLKRGIRYRTVKFYLMLVDS